MFYKFAKILLIIIFRTLYSIKVDGKENLISLSGGAILCANHSTNLDPILIAISSPRKLRFMGKAELFKYKIEKYVFSDLLGAFPVRRGENDLKAMKTAINVVKEGDVLVLFPEGTRNKDGQEVDTKAGIGFIVAKTKAPVIPVSIVGSPKLFSKFSIIIGEPIDFSKFYQEKITANEYKEISNIIMSKINGARHLSDESLIK